MDDRNIAASNIRAGAIFSLADGWAVGRNAHVEKREWREDSGDALHVGSSARRENCVDSWPRLTGVLRRIAAIDPGDSAALEALLPDRWVAGHPEHRLD